MKIILNKQGYEHFKKQAYIYAANLADIYASPRNNTYQPIKTKIKNLPLGLTTIYNEMSKTIGYKSLSDMKNQINNATGIDFIHYDETKSPELLKEIKSQITNGKNINLLPTKPILRDIARSHSIDFESNIHICEYLYYIDPDARISDYSDYDDEIGSVSCYCIDTEQDLSAGIRGSIYEEASSINELNQECKNNIISAMNDYLESL